MPWSAWTPAVFIPWQLHTVTQALPVMNSWNHCTLVAQTIVPWTNQLWLYNCWPLTKILMRVQCPCSVLSECKISTGLLKQWSSHQFLCSVWTTPSHNHSTIIACFSTSSSPHKCIAFACRDSCRMLAMPYLWSLLLVGILILASSKFKLI